GSFASLRMTEGGRRRLHGSFASLRMTGWGRRRLHRSFASLRMTGWGDRAVAWVLRFAQDDKGSRWPLVDSRWVTREYAHVILGVREASRHRNPATTCLSFVSAAKDL